METSIREMIAADYDAVAALWRATEGVGLDDDVDSRDGIARYLERNPGLSVVACRGAEIVAAVLCGNDGRRGYLHHLAVARDCCGQGLGRALVERCLAELRRRGFRKCHAFVFADNHPARAFWRRIAWQERTDLVVSSQDTRGPS